MRKAILVLSIGAAAACATGAAPEVPDYVPFEPDGDSTSTTGPELVDDRPVEHAAGVPPISGGTLLLLADGNTIVAADPDRDLLHVATIDPPATVATIALEIGDEPGRIAQDDSGQIHVVLRGAGALVSIDPTGWRIAAREPTCANPRGVAWDPDRLRVLVACAGGELVFHPAGAPLERRVRVADDLRDVFVQGGAIRVSRFRRAEVLTVDDDGAVTATQRPSVELAARIANTAWRTLGTDAGGWLMVHQSSMSIPIDLGVARPYEGGDSCSGPVASTIAIGQRDGTVLSSPMLSFATLPVDTAISPDGTQIAIAIAGQSDAFSPTMVRSRGVIVLETAELEDAPFDCEDPSDIPIPGQPVAVTFSPRGELVTQSREPAALYVTRSGGQIDEILLEGEPRRDTGHDLFHQDAGTAMSCASCHPEGGDDGLVWSFVSELGEPSELSQLRRTQPLRVGLAGSEPFHWSGDMPDFAELAAEIHVKRMGAREQSPERLAAFEEWLFELTPSNPERGDDELVRAGAALFVSRGCAACHGESGTVAERSAIVDGESLQVPNLRSVVLRAPYMHDGRVDDLRAAVVDMMRLTPDTGITADELDAVVAFLESL